MIEPVKEGGLKICMVIETCGGGSGRHVIDLCKELLARGHDVTVIWSPIRAETSWIEQLESLPNIKQYSLKMKRAVSLHDLKSLSELGNILKQSGPYDILHGHSSKAGALVRLTAKSVPGKRVYTPHAFRTMDPNLGEFKSKIYSTLEKWMAKKGDVIIAVSEYERQHALSIGIEDRQLKVIVNGVDSIRSNRDQVRTSLDIAKDTYVVGFVGRLSEQKNPKLFVQAMNLAPNKSSKVVAIIIGDGELSGELKAINLSQNCMFLGWKNAVEYFSAFDIYVMTSAYEAMPYTLLEALAAGLPIISTNVGGVEETIHRGNNGYVLPVNATAELLASTIRNTYLEKDSDNHFSSYSLTLSAKYTIAKMVDHTINVYR